MGMGNKGTVLLSPYPRVQWHPPGEQRLDTAGGQLHHNRLGFYNPLRYRGYVYDNETGLYYLQSRYYDPEICRFLNADALVSTGQGLLGNNMFAYCLNNPVMLVDSLGSQPIEAIDTNGDGEPDCYVYEYTYTVNYLFWSKTKKGYVYIYVGRTSGDFLETVQRPDKFNAASDLMAAYYISTDSNGNPNPVWTN